MAAALVIKSSRRCCMMQRYLLANSFRFFSDGQTNSKLVVKAPVGETQTTIPSISAAYQSFLVSYPMNMMITISPPVNHQVFINFRGDQLRYNFISHLTNAFKRRGIKIFIDRDELLGKDLTNLFVRIEESKIALAIFSTRYSESKWCINELVKMKKCADEGKVHVIPIFYKVDAKHVRKPTRGNEFGENFWNLVEASDQTDPIQEWREALKCICNKIGLSLGHNSSEADFIKEIVKEVERVNREIGLDEK